MHLYMYIPYVMLVGWCHVKDSQAICTPKDITTHTRKKANTYIGQYTYTAVNISYYNVIRGEQWLSSGKHVRMEL